MTYTRMRLKAHLAYNRLMRKHHWTRALTHLSTISNYKSLAHVVMEMSQNVPKSPVIEVAASTVIHYYVGCTQKSVYPLFQQDGCQNVHIVNSQC